MYGTCNCPFLATSSTHSGISTYSTFYPSPGKETIRKFTVHDIHTDDVLATASRFEIGSRDKKSGINGIFDRVFAPRLFKEYLVSLGTLDSEKIIWQMLSPILLKVNIENETDKSSSIHFLTVMNFESLEEIDEQVCFRNLKVQEIVDSLLFIRLVSRDVTYRKGLILS